MAQSKHTIRIISGTHGSRRIPVLNIPGLRPTGDRLREVLFNWLQMEIVGQKILDLCAGSGALGFEAASRGAKQVTMVELNSQAAKQLQSIVKEFEFEKVKVISQMAQTFLNNNKQTFDVVFLDPPFVDDLLNQFTEQVIPVVTVGGYLYREAAVSQELIKLPDNWELYRQKSAGQVKIELWHKLS